MTALAPTVEAFFTQRLAVQCDASPHTVAAYRDTLRLCWSSSATAPAHHLIVTVTKLRHMPPRTVEHRAESDNRQMWRRENWTRR